MDHISAQDELKFLNIEHSGDYVLVPKHIWDEINKKLNNINEEQIINFEINDVGDLIRATRIAHGLSQKEFAKKAKIEECQVSNFENKHKRPRPRTIDKINNAFEGFKIKFEQLINH